MLKKWMLIFPVAAVIAFAAGGVKAADPKPGGTLVVAVEGLIGILDPHISNSGLTHNINEQIYEKLFARDYTKPNDGTPPEILPELATGYEVSPDGLVYTVKLREGVKFHDGTDFNAQAVDFNIRRMWDKDFEYFFKDGASSLAVYVYGSLKDIEVVDDHTIKFILSKPFSFFIEELADFIGLGLPWMVSPEAVKSYGNEEVKNHPTGTGPFRFVEEVKGERVVLEKNSDYWAKPPYLDQLIFKPIADPAARANALAAGEVDLINAVAPDQIEQLEKDGFVIAKGPTPHIWYVEFNHSEKPFSDVRVRQAVNLAIDREGMAKELLRGSALPAICFCGRTSPTFNPPPEWTGDEYNPDKAKKATRRSRVSRWLQDRIRNFDSRLGSDRAGRNGRVDSAGPFKGRHRHGASSRLSGTHMEAVGTPALSRALVLIRSRPAQTPTTGSSSSRIQKSRQTPDIIPIQCSTIS